MASRKRADHSVLKRSIETNTTGMKQAMLAMKTGSPEVICSNGEFLQSEELTRKITFSATYNIFANQKIAGISFFTFFRVFSTIFVELHSKIFSPLKNLQKLRRKKSKITVSPGLEPALPVP